MASLPNVNQLLSEAEQEVAANAQAAVTEVNRRFGPHVAAMQGNIDDEAMEDASEVIILNIVIDDSSSIDDCDNAESVREGHNSILRALRGSKQAESILVGCRFFNDGPGLNRHVLYPFMQLAAAPMLTEKNYHPVGGTPLYDQVAIALAATIKQMAAVVETGTYARAVTVIITDGDDQHSVANTAEDVAAIVREEIRKEKHIIAGIGLPDPDAPVDYQKVFSSMGLLGKWVLTPDSGDSEIRHAFNTLTDTALLGHDQGDGFDDGFDEGDEDPDD